MSHWTTVQAEITDLSALEEALKSLGYKNIKKNATCRGYGSATRKADLVVVGAKGSYDIGFKVTGKKCEIIGDFSMMHINERNFKDDVHQQYSLALVKRGLRKKGLRQVTERVQKDGSIKLIVNLSGTRYGK